MTAPRMGAGAVKAAPKFSPWFPVNKKPTLIGFYEVHYFTGYQCVRYFNGSVWSHPDGGLNLFGYGNTRGEKWRGLAADPAKVRK